MNIVLVTNAMTPYRKFFYDKVDEYCKSKGIKFSVLTMTAQEFGYNWNYAEVDAPYNTLMKGYHFKRPVVSHANPSVGKYLAELSPDIIILGGSYTNITSWLVLKYAGQHRVPVYFWSESHLNEARKFGKLQKIIRNSIKHRFYGLCNGFFYAGKMSMNFILDANPAAYHLHLCPNLIDNGKYAAKSNVPKSELKKKWGLESSKKVALLPARLSWVKGIHLFVELLAKAESAKDVTVIIPGTGDYEKEIRQSIMQAGVDVRLLGYQQQKEMLELYSIADLFFLPSLSDPNPLSCIEALWSGLPLLVSDHVGNYPEVIEEGKNGYVFSYEKPGEAVEKIEKIISASAEWMQKASRISREIAEERFDPDKVVARLIEDVIYEQTPII